MKKEIEKRVDVWNPFKKKMETFTYSELKQLTKTNNKNKGDKS